MPSLIQASCAGLKYLEQLCCPSSPTWVCSEHPHHMVLLSLLCVECPLVSSQASWGQCDGPRRGNTLSSHLARLVRGFIDAGSAGRKAVSQPATPRGAFPVSLRWSHHYSQVITAPVTWLLWQDCHPWHPSSSHRAWERAPSAGTDRAISKCKADILMIWKPGCSLSPPYSLHKKSVSWSQHPWGPTFSSRFVCCLWNTTVDSFQ